MFRITASDMQAMLLRMVGGEAEPDMVSDIRKAIRSALRLVSAEYTWPYYCDYLHLNTQATVTTGTITYTASTRTVVLSGSTWPTWAAQGSIIINTFHARVDTVSNSTTLTVMSDDAPVADYTGSYSMYQYQYTLPLQSNIYKCGKAQVDQANWIEYVNPSIFETDIRKQYLASGGRPRWFTIQRDFRNVGQQILSLWPYPTTQLRMRMGYVRHPADIAVWSYETGKVAVNSSTTAVTGTGTAFTSSMVGCLLRTGSDIVNVPTDADGLYPAVNEGIISSYSSATSLALAANPSTTQSEASVCISSLMDIDYNIMLEVTLYKARLELAKIRRLDPALRAEHERDYAAALYSAKCQANTSNSVRVAGAFRNRAWAFPGQFDQYYSIG